MMTDNYHAILIPGGGLTDDGRLPSFVKRRLDRALELFTGNDVLITLSAGTVHKPLKVIDGKLRYESIEGARYLARRGVPSNRIRFESASYDTIGNMYFVRRVHTDSSEMSRLCIVTSNFHLPRTTEICDWVFSLTPLQFPYELEFVGVNDSDIDKESLDARVQRENESLATLLETRKGIKTLSEFHKWLFRQHKAYRFERYSQGFQDESLSEAIKKTY